MINRFVSFFALCFLTTAMASADLTQKLGAGDPLKGVAEAVGVQLGDSNISTGTTELSARQLNAKIARGTAEMKALTQDLFQEAFRRNYDGNVPGDAKLVVRSAKFKPTMVADAVHALSDSNAYNPDNAEINLSLNRSLWAVLRKLPVSEKTVVGSVKARFKRYSDDEEPRNVYYYVFLDLESSKLVQLFLVEGTM